MARPTPGPWKVPEYAPWQIVDSRYSSGTVIARVHEDLGHGRDKSESYANARLIGSAPELLEACKAALEFLREDLEDNDPDCDWTLQRELMQVGGALQSAVAKAEGVA